MEEKKGGGWKKRLCTLENKDQRDKDNKSNSF